MSILKVLVCRMGECKEAVIFFPPGFFNEGGISGTYNRTHPRLVRVHDVDVSAMHADPTVVTSEVRLNSSVSPDDVAGNVPFAGVKPDVDCSNRI